MSAEQNEGNPKRIFLGGREYPVEYIVYRYQDYNVEREEYADIYKLSLKNYGECDVFFKYELDKWDMEELDEPGTSFAQQAVDGTL